MFAALSFSSRSFVNSALAETRVIEIQKKKFELIVEEGILWIGVRL